MKVTQLVYAPTAARQYTYRFNKENNTAIEVTDEVIDGSSFIYIDFKNTSGQLIHQYSYELGRIQSYLSKKGESWLPVADYPFPPDPEDDFKFKFENKIVEHFGTSLTKRKIDSPISYKLTDEENLILSKVGLPNTILDFQFIDTISFLSESEITIGKLEHNNITLHLDSKKIIRDDTVFLAKSVKNFLLQMYTYDFLWKTTIPEKTLGHYRENSNYKKYARLLETELLKTDPDLLKNDNGYFWGSLIEDIEFGIVG